jgi:UDP-N-acetylbacillosamine N-acetyltransferase
MTDLPAIPAALLILGFGGHARSVADAALAAGVRQLAFVEPSARPDETFLGFPVAAAMPATLPEGWLAVAGQGSGVAREKALAHCEARGWPVATVIAPTASIGAGSTIGRGVFIGQQAHVGPLAVIGDGCLINSGAVVEHDCVIGPYSHVSVNATVAGRSSCGSHCFLGAGSTVIDKISICDGVTLGAGAVVIRDITSPGVHAGVPARLIGT